MNCSRIERICKAYSEDAISARICHLPLNGSAKNGVLDRQFPSMSGWKRGSAAPSSTVSGLPVTTQVSTSEEYRGWCVVWLFISLKGLGGGIAVDMCPNSPVEFFYRVCCRGVLIVGLE